MILKGVLRHYNPKKGIGHIRCTDRGQDLVFHVSACEGRVPERDLLPRTPVIVTLQDDPAGGRPKVTRVRLA